jgi:hypothetical protein
MFFITRYLRVKRKKILAWCIFSMSVMSTGEKYDECMSVVSIGLLILRGTIQVYRCTKPTKIDRTFFYEYIKC